MSSIVNRPVSRRNFLKLSGAATAGAVVGNRTGMLHALVPKNDVAKPHPIDKRFSICDMCFNKCGLIARVDEHGVVTKLDPNPKFRKSRGMLCARGNAGIRQLYDPARHGYGVFPGRFACADFRNPL